MYFLGAEKKESDINALVLYKSQSIHLENIVSNIRKNTKIDINFKYIIDDSIDEVEYFKVWETIENYLNSDSRLKDIDMLFGIPYEYQESLINKNKLLNLNYEISDEILGNIYEPIIDIAKKVGSGNIYFLSPTFSSQFLSINDDFFYRNGIEPPNTVMSWKNLERIFKSLDSGEEVFSLGPGGLEGISSDLEILLSGLSRKFIEDGKIYEDKDLVKELKWFIEFYKNYGYKKSYVEDSIVNKNVAARVIYPPQLSELTKNKHVNFKYSIHPLPTFRGLEDTANIRIQPISILASTNKKYECINVLSYIMSKDFAKFTIKEKYYMPDGNFVSYIDNEIKELYKDKYKLENVDFIYFGSKGAVNKSKFSLYEYYAFHEVSNLIIQDTIINNLNTEESINRIKIDFIKRSNQLREDIHN